MTYEGWTIVDSLLVWIASQVSYGNKLSVESDRELVSGRNGLLDLADHELEQVSIRILDRRWRTDNSNRGLQTKAPRNAVQGLHANGGSTKGSTKKLNRDSLKSTHSQLHGQSAQIMPLVLGTKMTVLQPRTQRHILWSITIKVNLISISK